MQLKFSPLDKLNISYKHNYGLVENKPVKTFTFIIVKNLVYKFYS